LVDAIENAMEEALDQRGPIKRSRGRLDGSPNCLCPSCACWRGGRNAKSRVRRSLRPD
jgi:hypothetical protein